MIGKSLLPKSLFGRALLILVVPTVLIQLVTAYVFFDRHWDNITRHMSSSLAGETAFLLMQLNDAPSRQKPEVVSEFELATNINVSLESSEHFDSNSVSSDFPEFRSVLAEKIHEPFIVRKSVDGSAIEIVIKLPQHTLTLTTSVKRLESRTTIVFLGWMLGASVLFLCIAMVFLRNQIRPISRLAEAAENFGRGVDMPGFRPHGAHEVRKAARAFIIMRERIRKQLRTRTDMLSGISHDLRTPLTRMKLQLAMLPENPVMRDAVLELNDDVQQMEHMIQEYLDFARDEGREDATRIQLDQLLEDVVSDYQRMKLDVTLSRTASLEIDARISALRRMLHNLIDNALRYGKRCDVSLRVIGSYVEIAVDDEGPGIHPEMHDEVFKPFSRLEKSRNSKTGGVGLGLTIARDVVLAHGGSIVLATAPAGGLRVLIRLPL